MYRCMYVCMYVCVCDNSGVFAPIYIYTVQIALHHYLGTTGYAGGWVL